MPHDLLILGASTRAAAFSALRCGFRPRCADYFADRDLAAHCPVDRIDARNGRHDFVAFAESLPPSPWFYTGGFENDPECVEQISRKHALWGMDARTLRAVRDPGQVADILTRNGIPCPKVCSEPAGLPRDGSWLKKPLASGGGRGIEPLIDQTDLGPATSTCYFQEKIHGPSFSALYIGQHSRATLICVTGQFIGGVAGSSFGYMGSIGPLPISQPLESRLESLGGVLNYAFGLTGWFGVDFILRDGIPWPVEVNPRYTASLEIYELASSRALLPRHRHFCDPFSQPGAAPARLDTPPSRVVAKWILYTPERLVAPDIRPEEDEEAGLFAVRSTADIPWPGTIIEPGEPVMTLMAAGANTEECGSRLVRLEQAWIERLGIAGGGRNLEAIVSSHGCPGGDDVLG